MVRIHFPPAESPSLVPPQIRTIRAASMTPSSNSMRTSCAGRCHFGAGAAVQLDVYRSARHTMEPGAHLFWVGYDLPRCCSASSSSPSGELTVPDRKRVFSRDRAERTPHGRSRMRSPTTRRSSGWAPTREREVGGPRDWRRPVSGRSPMPNPEVRVVQAGIGSRKAETP